MKKLIRRVLTLILIITALFSLSVSVSAGNTLSGNLSKDGVAYKLSDDGTYYTVVGTSDYYQPFLTIVSSIDGIPVTEIAESAFHNNTQVNSITIPSSVTKIGPSAFRYCKNLTSVELPSGLTFLPEECFYDCNMLTTIVLPDTLTTIDDECFKNCFMLGDVKIPASVTTIGYDVFLNCERLKLDVSENPYAADYAKKENLNTEFENTTGYFFIIVAISAVVGVILVVLLSIPLKRYFAKHPTHNPMLYVGKFFSFIGRGISFVYKKIKKLILFLVNKVVAFLEWLGKIIKAYRVKKLEKKEQKKKNDEQSSK